MTENPFICTFLPGPDHKDAELAEALDALHKTKWRDVGMIDVWARCAAWLVVGGTGFIQSRVDAAKGEFEDWIGKATLPLLGPDDQPVMGGDGQPVTQEVGDVPFNEKGEPQAILRHDGLQVTGPAHRERRGDLVVDVHSPLECRGQWGPLPWHQQPIHMVRSYLTPEEVWRRWKVECEPDVTDLPTGSAGFLERLLFGSGFYGAASAPLHPNVTGAHSTSDGYVCVQSTWMAPDPEVEGMEETPESPGGRLLVTTKDKTLKDGPRPARYKWTSPVRCYEFVRIPGRPWGSTPLEMMKSPQKAYNQGWKQILENRSLNSNPQQIYDLDSGLRADQIDNQPGRQYGIRMKPGIENPIKWITPPMMGPDVWRSQDAIQSELSFLGSNSGMDVQQKVGRKASGELIKELRFDDDRFVGPTMQRVAEEMGRMVEDHRAIFKVLYTTKTLLRYTGEDRAARTILLLPELFDTADATAVPDLESMMPEGRGERRQKVYQMWKDGALGDPQSPRALRQLHELGRFPNMSQTAGPGGIHHAAAQQEHSEMLAGRAPTIYEWQDMEVHLDDHETFMAAPEWQRLPDQIRALFMKHREDTLLAMVAKRLKMAQLAAMAQPPMPAGAPGDAPAPEPATAQ
jgi:hypothetical protein